MVLSIDAISVLAALVVGLIALFIWNVTRPEKMNLEERVRGNAAFVRSYTCSGSSFGKFYQKRLRKLMPESSLTKLGSFMGTDLDRLDEKIKLAGKEKEISVMEVLAMKALGGTVLIVSVAAFVATKRLIILIAGIYIALMLFISPTTEVDEAIEKKRKDVESHLMRYVENTRLCIVAGADLEESMKLIAENTEGELGRIVQEAFIFGSATGSWEEELSKAADALGVEEFQNFVSDIITARRTGANIGDALADEVVRLDAVNEARIMGEVKALPSKLGVLQIAFCMVPMFLIVLLPAAIQLMEVL